MKREAGVAETLRLDAAGWSNPALPVVIHRGRVPVGDPDAIEATLAANGWRPDWRDGVYGFHHFHSTAHEALACSAGWAELTLGGPEGERVRVAAGDLIVLPAGTGHCRETASDDFLVVGAYPDGQTWDVCREPADADSAARVAAVPLPASDPVDGPGGDLTQLWRDE